MTIGEATKTGPSIINLNPGLCPEMGIAIRAYPETAGTCRCERVIWRDGNWNKTQDAHWYVASDRPVIERE